MNTVKKLTLTLTTVTLLSILLAVPAEATTGTITVDSLRARTAPSTSSDVLRSVSQGDKLEIIDTTDEWYKVKLSDGKEAYVYSKYVKLDEEIKTNEEKQEEEDTESTEGSKTVEEIKLDVNTRIYILPVLFSSELGKVTEDITVQVIERINNWVCVEYNGVQGWVLGKGKTIETTTVITDENTENTESTDSTSEQTTKTGYVNVSSAYVRKDADKSADSITSMSLNTELTIVGEKNGWYEIKLSDGTGYIYGELVSDSKTKVATRSSVSRSSDDNTSYTYSQPESATGEASGTALNVVDYAKQFLDCEYVYGGSGPYTFDCSGFTMYVFSNYGVYLPHSASAQANYGSYVSRDNLQPGDLVIFNDRANSSIGHSGIYIGNNQFIHAENSSSDMQITSMDSGYYSARFVEGRRII